MINCHLATPPFINYNIPSCIVNPIKQYKANFVINLHYERTIGRTGTPKNIERLY